ncbi:hypothetical protein FHW83_000385 [Duganella sp. SG902]|uniref:hypothetical protein n=1 Tax=Duganella sp. SG902 TaxID=2587016 RepID=UPI00159D3C48|nr:hypothetical protein [Duganella sp. SG902]NVM74625.1 hypothetical protein [Duganella sp. SG902]
MIEPIFKRQILTLHRIIAGLQGLSKNFQVFSEKALKFPQALPLPFLDEQKSARRGKSKKI